jgi:energy-coupling factor transporter ATP-binding protein EcfA2
MKEGQGAAPASVPWDSADAVARVPARPSADTDPAGQPDLSEQAPQAGTAAEPHARVDARKLEAALLEFRDAVGRMQLLLECPGVAAARAERQQVISQVEDYLLPRLRQSGAPILIAMVGSTGAGKSTLLNSIAGSQVSATGIRRPTTNSPVLACHPDEVGWFAENVFLPSLPRVRQQGLAMPGRDGLLVLATSPGMPRGIALLDTPDIDSVVAAHRQFARQFLDASDLWLFVTTARRYADAVVWDMLKDARERAASLAIVLSRVPPSAIGQLTAHFGAMLEANGLVGVPRFAVPETVVTDAQLPAEVSEPVRSWLEDTSRREDRRIAILTQTMSGVLDSFEAKLPALAAEAQTQLELCAELRSAADAAYSAALAEHGETIRSGSLLSGEVIARWQDFAGTGDLMRTLEIRKTRRASQRSKRHGVITARAQSLKAALRISLEALTISLADRAAEDALERWQSSPAGAGLLAEARQAQRLPLSSDPSYASLRKWEGELRWGFPGVASELAASLPQGGVDALGRSSPDLPRRVTQSVSAWQEYLLNLVQTENVTRRSIARLASFDPESLALVLTVAVLGYGAGEAVGGDDASAVPQRLLTSLFGDGLLRDIGGQARQDLHERIGLLYSEEALRFTALLDAAGAPDETAPADLYQASKTLESAR